MLGDAGLCTPVCVRVCTCIYISCEHIYLCTCVSVLTFVYICVHVQTNIYDVSCTVLNMECPAVNKTDSFLSVYILCSHGADEGKGGYT